MFPFRSKRRGTDDRPPAKVPLLIANGWAPFPLPIHLVRRQYEKLGFEVVVIPFSLRDMRDIDAFAQHVANFVLRFCVDRRISKVNLMGISLGGVAGLAAIKRYGLAPYVATFASVGAPLLGSPLWVAALPSGVFTSFGRQIRPYSRYLTALARLKLPDGPFYLAVAGDKDRTCPVWSALIPGAHQNIVMSFGHGAVLGSRTIPPVIEPFLAREPP